MWFYLPIVFVPALLVVVVSKFLWPHHITMREWGLQLLGLIVGSLLCLGLIWTGSGFQSGDFSIFNGYVTDKERVEVTCEHEYKCGETCRTVTTTDSKGKKSSRQECTPVYCKRHSYDVDWDVYTTLGRWTIDRIDSRGLEKPPRWDMVEKGDPVSESRYVQNFMLLDAKRFKTADDIFARFRNKLMDYPSTFDYYRFNRIVQDDNQDFDGINVWLNEKLRTDGALKQLNVILVVTHNDADYYYALMQYWRGARKNDVILFYGLDDENNVKWARATSFADGQNNQVMLNQLQSMTLERKFDAALVQEQYALIVKDFQRLPNHTFEYLRSGWIPPTWWVITMAVINLLIAIGIAWFMKTENVA